jgi:hypothetical protein
VKQEYEIDARKVSPHVRQEMRDRQERAADSFRQVLEHDLRREGPGQEFVLHCVRVIR